MAKGQRTSYYAMRMFRQGGRVYQEGQRVVTIDAKLINFYIDGGYVKKVVERIEVAQNTSTENQLTLNGDTEEPIERKRGKADTTVQSKPQPKRRRKTTKRG